MINNIHMIEPENVFKNIHNNNCKKLYKYNLYLPAFKFIVLFKILIYVLA